MNRPYQSIMAISFIGTAALRAVVRGVGQELPLEAACPRRRERTSGPSCIGRKCAIHLSSLSTSQRNHTGRQPGENDTADEDPLCSEYQPYLPPKVTVT